MAYIIGGLIFLLYIIPAIIYFKSPESRITKSYFFSLTIIITLLAAALLIIVAAFKQNDNEIINHVTVISICVGFATLIPYFVSKSITRDIAQEVFRNEFTKQMKDNQRTNEILSSDMAHMYRMAANVLFNDSIAYLNGVNSQTSQTEEANKKQKQETDMVKSSKQIAIEEYIWGAGWAGEAIAQYVINNKSSHFKFIDECGNSITSNFNKCTEVDSSIFSSCSKEENSKTFRTFASLLKARFMLEELASEKVTFKGSQLECILKSTYNANWNTDNIIKQMNLSKLIRSFSDKNKIEQSCRNYISKQLKQENNPTV